MDTTHATHPDPTVLSLPTAAELDSHPAAELRDIGSPEFGLREPAARSREAC